MQESFEDLARAVDIAKERYELAVRKLLAALSITPPPAPTLTAHKALPNGDKSDVPVAQRARELLAANPAGLTRDELKQRLGDTPALHSFLKKASADGKITSSGKRGAPWRLVVDKKKGPRP
jgi:hypothetical protein